ncbi:MAG: patatin [Pedobacter sp.]|nr:MAG: patatin [Pedobacter sp.]
MKIGIVLSGGGIRGIAHLGILRAVVNYGIKISHISGTSAGAIAGSFFAAGYSPDEIFNIFQKTKLLRYIRPAFGSLGLINIEPTREILKPYFQEDRIESLQIPLTICTTNFSEGKIVYFSEGPLITSVLASSCIPGIFKPIEIDNQMYVDGGVLNNFPVEPLQGICDLIIGSSCNHLLPQENIKGLTNLIQRAAIMSINHDMEVKRKSCNLMIEPKGMGEISTFDMKKAETIYWLAHEAALKTLQSEEVFKNYLNHGNPI